MLVVLRVAALEALTRFCWRCAGGGGACRQRDIICPGHQENAPTPLRQHEQSVRASRVVGTDRPVVPCEVVWRIQEALADTEEAEPRAATRVHVFRRHLQLVEE